MGPGGKPWGEILADWRQPATVHSVVAAGLEDFRGTSAMTLLAMVLLALIFAGLVIATICSDGW